MVWYPHPGEGGGVFLYPEGYPLSGWWSNPHLWIGGGTPISRWGGGFTSISGQGATLGIQSGWMKAMFLQIYSKYLKTSEMV